MPERNQIKAYISHSIRGKFGINATCEQMEVNNQKAIAFGKFIREAFPAIEWYIPGDHDEFVLYAYLKKYINEKQILDIDCAIIDTCNFMLIYSPDDHISRGMQIEIDHCTKSHKQVLSAVDGDYSQYIQALVEATNCYLVTLMR